MTDKIVSVNIINLPADGGAPITDIEYRVNEGAAISLGETTTGSYQITADVDDDVQIRAVNAIGPGDWSDTKVVPEAVDDPIQGVIDLLFANDEPGFLGAVSPEYCFTDEAGTEQAGAGDRVRVLEFPAGSVASATQATSANRPTLGREPKDGARNILRETAALPTQTRAVTADEYTLSFRGTGTVTLTGASTAGPLFGTGAEDIVSLTFTPSEGDLTLTVSGDVFDAQLELGDARTGYQLVADADGFDITEAGKPDCWYLYGGGAADPRWMSVPEITPGTSRAQVFAGMQRIAPKTENGCIFGGDRIVTNSSTSLEIFSPVVVGVGRDFGVFQSGGSSISERQNGYLTSFASAPFSSVMTTRHDLRGSDFNQRMGLRLNGNAQTLIDDRDNSLSLDFAADNWNIMRRGNDSAFFFGKIYFIAVRFGDDLDAAETEQVEEFIAGAVAEETIT